MRGQLPGSHRSFAVFIRNYQKAFPHLCHKHEALIQDSFTWLPFMPNAPNLWSNLCSTIFFHNFVYTLIISGVCCFCQFMNNCKHSSRSLRTAYSPARLRGVCPLVVLRICFLPQSSVPHNINYMPVLCCRSLPPRTPVIKAFIPRLVRNPQHSLAAIVFNDDTYVLIIDLAGLLSSRSVSGGIDRNIK